MARKKATSSTKKKVYKNVPLGIAHINATLNNTIITITDPKGDVVCWKSSGTVGFKGTKKGTPFAAQLATEELSKIAKENGIRRLEVRVKGPGQGREASIRAFPANGIEISSIKDVTPIPHNGCRAPKKRRV